MQEHVAEKFAALFADCAVSGNPAELRKEAAAQELVKDANTFTDLATNPLVYAPLIGAGVGGASGYFGTGKEKDKKRNALYGAAIGGLGGLGLPLMALAAGQNNGAGGEAGGDAKPQPAVAPGDLSTNNPNAWTNPVAKALSFLTGGGVGGAVGSKAVDAVGKATVGRNNELDRLGAAPGGKTKPNPYAAPINQIIEKHRLRGQPVTSSLDGLLLPKAPRPWVDPRQPPKTPAAQQKLEAARAVYDQKMKAWEGDAAKAREAFKLKQQIAERIVGKGSLGWRNKTRMQSLPVLEEMLRNNSGRGGSVPTTVLNDLNKHQRSVSPAARRLGYGVGSGVGSTLLSNPYVTDHLQNLLARLLGTAPPTAEAPAAQK